MKTIKLDGNIISNANDLDLQFMGLAPYSNFETINMNDWLTETEALEYHMYGLEVDGKIVAIASVGDARDRRMSLWQEIMSLYVHPEYKDIKYGGTLLHDLIDILTHKGHVSTFVWVLEEDYDARDFYEKQCFVPNGNRDQLLMHDQHEGLLRYVFVNI